MVATAVEGSTVPTRIITIIKSRGNISCDKIWFFLLPLLSVFATTYDDGDFFLWFFIPTISYQHRPATPTFTFGDDEIVSFSFIVRRHIGLYLVLTLPFVYRHRRRTPVFATIKLSYLMKKHLFFYFWIPLGLSTRHAPAH